MTGTTTRNNDLDERRGDDLAGWVNDHAGMLSRGWLAATSPTMAPWLGWGASWRVWATTLRLCRQRAAVAGWRADLSRRQTRGGSEAGFRFDAVETRPRIPLWPFCMDAPDLRPSAHPNTWPSMSDEPIWRGTRKSKNARFRRETQEQKGRRYFRSFMSGMLPNLIISFLPTSHPAASGNQTKAPSSPAIWVVT
jgi:hypothetical protein